MLKFKNQVKPVEFVVLIALVFALCVLVIGLTVKYNRTIAEYNELADDYNNLKEKYEPEPVRGFGIPKIDLNLGGEIYENKKSSS